ncbi:MAG: ASKHA domain-containing protein [Treponema sp.]|nr:ASKHA domain-containing protein [Treponema sp.]
MALKKNKWHAGIALDIGTTTIQAELVNLDTGESVDTLSVLNSQRSFGADVISRISAAQSKKTNELFSAVNNQSEGILQHFICKHDLLSIKKCAVSGNTTMLHLFCRADPSKMGSAPYTPEFLEERRFEGKELLLSAEQVILLPGISAFIGADIAAGLTCIDILNKNDNTIFIDIGTNGEMALLKKDAAYESRKKLLCCSTAAGPCFEGADISCNLNAADFIDAIAEMKRSAVIDKTGALAAQFAQNGFPVRDNKTVTQNDVRQFQLAKSAIYSGIKLLCKKSGTELEKIKDVYITGGMGEHLNPESAAETGLLPREFASKAIVCGNLSLKGAAESLTDDAFLPRCRDVISCAEIVDLAYDKYFIAAYTHNMKF